MKCFWCETEIGLNEKKVESGGLSFHKGCFKEAFDKLKQLALERTGKANDLKEKIHSLRGKQHAV